MIQAPKELKEIHTRKSLNRGWKVYSFKGREAAVRELRSTDRVQFNFCNHCNNKGVYLIIELWDIKSHVQEVWAWCGKC